MLAEIPSEEKEYDDFASWFNSINYQDTMDEFKDK
jgi:hypothetical protein|tara:strand:+ start:1482 stop:1586 length:105 start_codon:yes stop_codon:yes gene_type:complete